MLRIPVEKWLIRPLQIALIALIMSNVVLTLLWIFQCRPIAGAWDKSKNASCFSKFQKEAIIFAQASKIENFIFLFLFIAIQNHLENSRVLKFGGSRK